MKRAAALSRFELAAEKNRSSASLEALREQLALDHRHAMEVSGIAHKGTKI
jgi:hypothetical protein